MASTVNFRVGDDTWINGLKMTTMGAWFLQRFLRRAVRDGCDTAVIEVTSHALVQSRVWGIDFGTVVLTNVTGDHVEYHGGFERYKEAKGLLFRDAKVSVINGDDPHAAYFAHFPAERRYMVGLKGGDVHARNVVYHADGTDFTLVVTSPASSTSSVVPSGEVACHTLLPGAPNLWNVLAACAVVVDAGVPLSVVAATLPTIHTVPGRYELVTCGQPFSVVIDYAHNIDAMRSLLELYRSLTQGKLIVVFGATGGGRDKGKRSVLGALLDQYADAIVLTDDDPYEEDEWEIIEMVAQGIKRTAGDRLWKILSRREAIRLALEMARAGDTVIIAGKGAETVQVMRGGPVPWNDRMAVVEILGELG